MKVILDVKPLKKKDRPRSTIIFFPSSPDKVWLLFINRKKEEEDIGTFVGTTENHLHINDK